MPSEPLVCTLWADEKATCHNGGGCSASRAIACKGALAGNECFGALWETKWSVELTKMVEALAPASWNKTLRALRRIISAEESWMGAPDSNKEWAQTYANKSLLFVLELLLKKEGAREQTRLASVRQWGCRPWEVRPCQTRGTYRKCGIGLVAEPRSRVLTVRSLHWCLALCTCPQGMCMGRVG